MAYQRLRKTSDGTKINRQPGMGGRNLGADTYAWNYDLPCRNPNCKSHGKPHPNCQCYGAGGEGDYAKGGSVCMGPHKPECEYFVAGGHVEANPSTTLGHASVNHGLLSVLENLGNPKIADPEKHGKNFEKMKSHIFTGDHDKAMDLVHGTPMGGSAPKHRVKEVLGHLSQGILNQQSSPEALRSSIDYMHSANLGNDELKSHSKKMIGKEALHLDHDANTVKKLKEKIEELKMNPEKMLDVGGHLGHYQPDHAAELGALTARAVEYLSSLKPPEPQMSPLDDPMEPDKSLTASWDRQLEIAEKPQSVMKRIKDGTILSQDLITVKTIYPGLYESMVSKAGEALVEAKTNKVEIPYHQRIGLSQLLGEPLDATMTPEAMQAIIKSAGPQQAQNQSKGPKKASGTEMSQINKVDQMGETTLEARQINRNKH